MSEVENTESEIENIEESNNSGDEHELNLDFEVQPIDDESTNEEENENETNDNQSHRVTQLRKAERNLRSRNSELESQLNELKNQIAQYEQLFQSTYSNAVPQNQSNHQQKNGELSPELSIEDRVNKIIEEREANNRKVTLQAQQAQEAESLKSELAQSVNSAMQKYSDYEECVMNQNIPFSKSIVDAITFLPNQGEMLYALAKNPKELERISRLSVPQQIKALTRHSVKIASKLGTSSYSQLEPVKNNLPGKSTGAAHGVDYSKMTAQEIYEYKDSLRR